MPQNPCLTGFSFKSRNEFLATSRKPTIQIRAEILIYSLLNSLFECKTTFCHKFLVFIVPISKKARIQFRAKVKRLMLKWSTKFCPKRVHSFSPTKIGHDFSPQKCATSSLRSMKRFKVTSKSVTLYERMKVMSTMLCERFQS